MTSDGITPGDWDKIHELAVAIANASVSGDDILIESRTAEMLAELKEFKIKYGELPSLLATEADYIQDPAQRTRLLETALEKAKAIGDVKNQILITESLNELRLQE